MKNSCAILLVLSLLIHQNCAAQGVNPTTQPGPSATAGPLVRFDLDFRGGNPRELVAAIERASRKPINAIVKDEDLDTKIPALKMNNVSVPELFTALATASIETELYQPSGPSFPGQYQSRQTSYGFRTEGPQTNDSIWSFYRQKPAIPVSPPQSKMCRFYNLAPYLDTFQVDDITTAVTTGWKLLGEKDAPTLNFHKDTQLLIAVGTPSQLQLIDSALEQLSQVTRAKQLPPRPQPVAPIPARP